MKINDETQGINQNPVAFQEDVPTKDISYWEWFGKNAPANKLNSEQLKPVSLQYPKPAGASNYYEALGVNPNASATEIQNAIPAKMGEINEAIQVLSDSDKRQAYDSGINSVVQSQAVNQPRLQVPPDPYSGIATTDNTYQNSLELAGRDTRLVAVLVDFLILLLPLFFAVLIAFFFFEDVFNISDVGKILAGHTEILTDQFEMVFEMVIALLGFVLLSLLIIVILNLGWLCENGQTIGKRLLSIKIVRTDGSKAGLLRIICLRGVVVPLIAFVSTLPWWKSIIFFVNHLLIFQESRRCGHDLIADTTVIEAIRGGSTHRSTAETIIAAIILIILSLVMIGGIVKMANNFTILDTVNFDHIYYFSSYKTKQAVSFLEQLKTPAEQYFSFTEKFPPSVASIKGKHSNKYVADIISNPEKFFFQAILPTKEHSPISEKTIRLIYDPKQGWKCGSGHPNGIDKKYLPRHCRNKDQR